MVGDASGFFGEYIYDGNVLIVESIGKHIHSTVNEHLGVLRFCSTLSTAFSSREESSVHFRLLKFHFRRFITAPASLFHNKMEMYRAN